MSDEQHREDTKYLKWSDGMYVMLEDLECDYELALIENSLRDSVYFGYLEKVGPLDNCIGVMHGDADYWARGGYFREGIKLTRAQALYIATGETNI
jgi:hypothetical protein